MHGNWTVATAVPVTVTVIVSGLAQALAPSARSQTMLVHWPGASTPASLPGTGATTLPLASTKLQLARLMSPEITSLKFTSIGPWPVLQIVRMNALLRVEPAAVDGISR